MAQATKTADDVLHLVCREHWTECQKKQACGKIKKLRQEVKKKKGGRMLRRVTPNRKRLKKNAQARYRNNNPRPGGKYYDKCAKLSNKKQQADHPLDAQLGGPSDTDDMIYLDQSVNTSFGSQMDKQSPKDSVSNITSEGCGC